MLKTVSTTFVSAVLACAAFGQANQPPAGDQPKFYNLQFQVQELEAGKVVNGRSYYMMVSSESNPSTLRTGGRVPYSSGNGQQINFLEIGVNIDCRAARERDGHLSLAINADISSLMPAPESVPNAPPVVRQNRWGSNVVVPLRKPAVISRLMTPKVSAESSLN